MKFLASVFSKGDARWHYLDGCLRHTADAQDFATSGRNQPIRDYHALALLFA